MPGLSKTRILAHRQCPKRLWLSEHRPTDAVFDEAYQSILATGHRVGAIACAQYPDGYMLPDDLRVALQETTRQLQTRPRPLFEASFQHAGIACRADILVPAGRGPRAGWRMVEVKSTTEIKDYQREDVAVQAWVIEQSGLKLKSIALSHIDAHFRYRGASRYHGLLIEKDITDATWELAKEVPEWVAQAQATLRRRKAPSVAPGVQCETPFLCPFAGYCSPPPDEKYPVEILPGASGKALAKVLRREGYGDLRKVPASRMTSEKLRKIHRLTKQTGAEVDPVAKEKLGYAARPRYYIDFETVSPAIPLWKGTRPFERVPFQWSCHIENRNGRVTHLGYLASGCEDPRREFAVTLLDVLRSQGTIFVYNANFECGVLRALAALFPDLSSQIESVLARVLDLLPIARDHYYHRDQKGSWSIKAILPTIAPDLAYDDLKVAGGTDAMDAYARAIDTETPSEERAALRAHLQVYCARDTEAMIELVRVFEDA